MTHSVEACFSAIHAISRCIEAKHTSCTGTENHHPTHTHTSSHSGHSYASANCPNPPLAQCTAKVRRFGTIAPSVPITINTHRSRIASAAADRPHTIRATSFCTSSVRGP